MDGPGLDLRSDIAGRLTGIEEASDEEAEGLLDAMLRDIEGELQRDLANGFDDRLPQDSAIDLLGAIEAWAGLISAATARVYAPASPWRRNVAGWAKAIAGRLRWLTNLLLAPLRAAATALGASGYSIGLNFPWGVSVQLNWS